VADICAGAALQKLRSAFLRIIQTQQTTDIETIEVAAVQDMLVFLQMIQAKDLQLIRTWAVPMARLIVGAPGSLKPGHVFHPSSQSGVRSGAADAVGGPLRLEPPTEAPLQLAWRVRRYTITTARTSETQTEANVWECNPDAAESKHARLRRRVAADRFSASVRQQLDLDGAPGVAATKVGRGEQAARSSTAAEIRRAMLDVAVANGEVHADGARPDAALTADQQNNLPGPRNVNSVLLPRS
jgi:hypothetical protein